MHMCVYVPYGYILSLSRYATGRQLHNGATGCLTGCPIALLAIHCCQVMQLDATRAAQLGNQVIENYPARQLADKELPGLATG